MDLAVTTALDAPPDVVRDARAAAARHGAPWIERRDRPLAAVARESGAAALLVVGRRRSTLLAGGEEHRWDPGMGALRRKRLARGETATREPFLEAAGLVAGDAVLDCTLGLGADALVAAEAAGPRGRVVGLESSRPIAAWVAEGLARLPGDAARRIEVRAADHAEFLAACPERSFDVVCFDPMFRHARAEPPLFAVLRRLADSRPLSPASLARARRVARRCVVVKDGAPGWDLARLGLAPLPSRRGAHRLYARVDAA